MIMSVTLVRHDKVYPLNEIKTKTKTWCADIRHRVNIYSQSKSPCVIKKIESIKFLSATLTKSYTLYRTKYRATKGLGASLRSLVWQLVTAVHTHTHTHVKKSNITPYSKLHKANPFPLALKWISTIPSAWIKLLRNKSNIITSSRPTNHHIRTSVGYFTITKTSIANTDYDSFNHRLLKLYAVYGFNENKTTPQKERKRAKALYFRPRKHDIVD